MNDIVINEQHNDLLVCRDCGALQEVAAVGPSQQALCSRCNNHLRLGRGPWAAKATSLALTALILFFISNAFTFLTLKVAGVQQSATILSGVGALLDRDQWILAAMVFTTIFLYPLLEILALMYILVPFSLNRRISGQKRVFRYLVQAQPWSMLDVFLLGVLVTTVKLMDQADVTLGPGMYVFFLLVAVRQMSFWVMDRNNVWNWLHSANYFSREAGEPLFDCGVCKAVVGASVIDMNRQCPRCVSPLHRRTPKSLQKTLALLLAATILYIPANLLPIMTYEELGVFYSSTILSGVMELGSAGLWGVATIVFVASIVVPITKLIILFYLVWSVHSKRAQGARNRTFLFRVTEVTGRWSMVDVFVVTLLTAVVQFGFIGEVEPGGALLPFGAVVVLTMLAAESFDPRLIWDHVPADAKAETPDPDESPGLIALVRLHWQAFWHRVKWGKTQ